MQPLDDEEVKIIYEKLYDSSLEKKEVLKSITNFECAWDIPKGLYIGPESKDGKILIHKSKLWPVYEQGLHEGMYSNLSHVARLSTAELHNVLCFCWTYPDPGVKVDKAYKKRFKREPFRYTLQPRCKLDVEMNKIQASSKSTRDFTKCRSYQDLIAVAEIMEKKRKKTSGHIGIQKRRSDASYS